MKKWLIGMFSIVLCAPFVFGNPSIAHAAGGEVGEYDYDTGAYYVNGEQKNRPNGLLKSIQYVGGGKWSHYVTSNVVHSWYNHETKSHSATVKNSQKTKKASKGKKYPAIAELPSTLWGNKVYWNTY
ncbi:lactococcin 972 family bacteriocin [Listeria ilorinensis]|uniref:lactococcin 972 family bacteriocin n=1 Tax=Listeria ilorinensis TaxID=2867439 RepID=UPI001EF697A1|nr:lactococcin 972 family bacteriocin [Listeria ilorinensis]